MVAAGRGRGTTPSSLRAFAFQVSSGPHPPCRPARSRPGERPEVAPSRRAPEPTGAGALAWCAQRPPRVKGFLSYPVDILDIVLLVVLAVVLALFSLEYGRTMPTLSLLVLSLIVLGVALVALFLPIVAIPGAATTDLGTFTINGFWGTASTAGPPTGWSWGPGLGWWILLLAVVLGTVGAVLPYVKSIRSMIPSPPPGWRPSS